MTTLDILKRLHQSIPNVYGLMGLAGNLDKESGIQPNNLQNTGNSKLGMTDAQFTAALDSGAYTKEQFISDRNGYGLAQWTSSGRKKNFYEFMQSRKVSFGDAAAQCDFLIHELKTSYAAVWKVLLSATSIQEASDIVLMKFEIPANAAAKKAERAKAGQALYTKYAASLGVTTSTKGETTSMSCSYSKVLAVAVGEIGYHEKATNANLDDKTANTGSKDWTKYARDFDQKFPNWYNGKKNGYAWCDMFVDWCFLTAYGYQNALRLLCQPEKSAGAGCTYSYAYYKKKGLTGKTPKVAAQIFFGKSENALTHTGIVEKFDATYVYTIEGNTSNQVARRTYKRTDANIFGYGYPQYDDAASTATSTTQNTTQQTTTAPTTPAQSKPSATTQPKQVKATGVATKKDTSLTGTYCVAAESGLNLRDKPNSNTGTKVLVCVPLNTKVQCYGYYTPNGDTKWLYVQFTYKGVTYTGFMSHKYLSKV